MGKKVIERQEVRDPEGLGKVSKTVTQCERNEVTVRKKEVGREDLLGTGN